MSELTTDRHVSRAQFLRNTAKGSIALAVGGSVLASVDGVAFAAGGVSDNSTLQAAYAAETLAVHVYTAVLASFNSFKHPTLTNIDYFQAALQNEKDHKAFLGTALGDEGADRPDADDPGLGAQVRPDGAELRRRAGDRVRLDLPRRRRNAEVAGSEARRGQGRGQRGDAFQLLRRGRRRTRRAPLPARRRSPSRRPRRCSPPTSRT